MSPGLSIHSGPLVLVNGSHPLPTQPERGDLVPADPRSPDILLHRQAAVLLEQLRAHVGGGTDIVPVSGFRPRREQAEIWADSMARHGGDFTRTYVARPGCSEHQTGLAVDLGENRPDLDFICPSFPDAGVFRAFRLACPGYGFILRYPAGREPVTGIGHEPWHFRYVGWPHARFMTGEGLVLEEYIELLRGYHEDGPHLHLRFAGRAFELFHVRAGDLPGLSQRLPADRLCQCSGDNVDGVVVTLWRDV